MIRIRSATLADLPFYLELQRSSWGIDMAVAESKAQYRFDTILDRILIAEEDGQPVGTTTITRLSGYDFGNPMSWNKATGDGWCTTHDPNGTVCFGVDLSIKPEYGSKVLDALYAGCGHLVILSGTKYAIFGGRLPGWKRYLERNPGADPETYLWGRTPSGRYLDPQVDMYMKAPGLRVIALIPDYFADDDSQNYGVLLRWRNPFYGLPVRRLWAKLFLIGYALWQRIDLRLKGRNL